VTTNQSQSGLPLTTPWFRSVLQLHLLVSCTIFSQVEISEKIQVDYTGVMFVDSLTLYFTGVQIGADASLFVKPNLDCGPYIPGLPAEPTPPYP
jgi:hypothetical protein